MRSSAPFLALLAVAILVRLALTMAVPYGPAVAWRLEGLNDEPAHLNYVRYLVEHRAFPVQTNHVRAPGAFERGDFEYYQPPLYYLLCAPLAAALGEAGALAACRLVSFACGLLSLVVLARVLALAGCGLVARRAGVLFVAFLPTHAYFSAVASNDALTWLLCLLLTHELLRLAGAGVTAGPSPAADPRALHLRIGLLLAAGLLTKSSVMIFVLAALFVYAARALDLRKPAMMRGALLALALAGLVAGPWYARNLAVYGSWLPLEVGFGPPEEGRTSPPALYWTVAGTIRYFWFPMSHIPQSLPAKAVRVLGALIVALHLVWAFVHLRRTRPLGLPRAVLVGLFLLTLAAHLSLNLTWGESEGRFLLPALGSLAFLMVAPIFARFGDRPAGARLATAWCVLAAAHGWVLLAFA